MEPTASTSAIRRFGRITARVFLTGVIAAALWVCVSAALRTTRAGKEAMTESIIRERVEGWAKAFRARDIDGIMAFYADDIVSFDLGPPLRYAGTEAKRRAWQAAFASYTGPIGYEVRELSVTTNGDLAFVHSLNRVSGTLASGHPASLWLRWTAGFRRTDGVWLIEHDHVSVPADVAQGQAALNLEP
jgi:ketosteroid isomerase-like protein